MVLAASLLFLKLLSFDRHNVFLSGEIVNSLVQKFLVALWVLIRLQGLSYKES